jgi:hypothetical protein
MALAKAAMAARNAIGAHRKELAWGAANNDLLSPRRPTAMLGRGSDWQQVQSRMSLEHANSMASSDSGERATTPSSENMTVRLGATAKLVVDDADGDEGVQRGPVALAGTGGGAHVSIARPTAVRAPAAVASPRGTGPLNDALWYRTSRAALASADAAGTSRLLDRSGSRADSVTPSGDDGSRERVTPSPSSARVRASFDAVLSAATQSGVSMPLPLPIPLPPRPTRSPIHGSTSNAQQQQQQQAPPLTVRRGTTVLLRAAPSASATPLEQRLLVPGAGAGAGAGGASAVPQVSPRTSPGLSVDDAAMVVTPRDVLELSLLSSQRGQHQLPGRLSPAAISSSNNSRGSRAASPLSQQALLPSHARSSPPSVGVPQTEPLPGAVPADDVAVFASGVHAAAAVPAARHVSAAAGVQAQPRPQTLPSELSFATMLAEPLPADQQQQQPMQPNRARRTLKAPAASVYAAFVLGASRPGSDA